MKKTAFKVISLITVFMILMFSSGCSFNFFSIESLLAPPVLPGKNGEVQTAFSKLMNSKTIQLKTPSKGNYKSSFILYDIDNNGEEEALVFYTDTSVDTSVRLALMECVNDTWIIASDVKGSGNGVYAVDFSDFNGDGKKEILVGWSLFENKTSRIITSYSADVGDTGVLTLNTILNEYYNSTHIVDFNSDGTDDLILVYLDDSGETVKSYFRAFSLSNDNEMVKFSELLLDSSVISVSSIKSDTSSSEKGDYTRVFIDCYKSDSSMYTEVVVWNDKKLKASSLFDNASVSTLRSSKLSSSDFDGDGRIEIPVTDKLPGKEEDLTATVSNEIYTFTLIKWMNVTGDKSEGNIYTVFDPIHSYLFRYTWNGTVSVRYDIFRGALVFYKWDVEKNIIDDELFSVLFVVNEDEIITEGMKKLYESDDGLFYYSITDSGHNFGITDDTLVSSFIKI